MGVLIIGFGELMRLVADIVKFSKEVLAAAAPATLHLTQQLGPLVEACIRAGHTAFYVGALLPVLADAAASIPILGAHARDYAALGPLWRAITNEFPELAFRAGRNVHSRFYRREIEIRDGLVLLGPFYDRAVAAKAEQAAAGQPDAQITVAVALIRAALRAHSAGQPSPNPHPLPISGADNRHADIAWILRLAAAFSAAEKAEPVPAGR